MIFFTTSYEGFPLELVERSVEGLKSWYKI